MILGDQYALNRKWWDSDWKPTREDTDWTDWDFVLAGTFQTIEDFTDKETGQYLPYDQSGEVSWDVKSQFSGSKEAIEREQERRKELKHGESLYAIPVFNHPDNKPTLQTWAKEVIEDTADRRPESAKGSRPPTPEELAAMNAVN